MVWGSIHCGANLPRDLENLAAPPRETALLEQVQRHFNAPGLGPLSAGFRFCCPSRARRVSRDTGLKTASGRKRDFSKLVSLSPI
jgi:hypothetical protein